MTSSSMWQGAETALAQMSNTIIEYITAAWRKKTYNNSVVLVQGWDGVGRCVALRHATPAITEAMKGLKEDKTTHRYVRVVPVDISEGDEYFVVSRIREARARELGLRFLPDHESFSTGANRYHVVIVNNYYLQVAQSSVVFPVSGCAAIHLLPALSHHGGGYGLDMVHMVKKFSDLSVEEAMGLLLLEAQDVVDRVRRRAGNGGRHPTIDGGAALDCYLYCTLQPNLHNAMHHWRAEGLLGDGFEHSRDASALVRSLCREFGERCMLEKTEAYGPFGSIQLPDTLIQKVEAVFSLREEQQGRGVLMLMHSSGLREFPSFPEGKDGRGSTTDHIHRISLAHNNIEKLPLSLCLPRCCPNLCTLMINDNARLQEIPDDMFSPEMPSLRVIDFSGTDIVKLPSSLTCCYNLRMLSLNRCRRLETLSPVVETGLDRLEVLSVESSPLHKVTRLSLHHMHNLQALCFSYSFAKLEEYNLSVKNGGVFEEHGIGSSPMLPGEPIERAHICVGDVERKERNYLISSQKLGFYRHPRDQTQLWIHPRPVGVEETCCRRLEVHGGEENVLECMIAPKICEVDFMSLYNNQAAMQIDLNDFGGLRSCRIERCHRIIIAVRTYVYHKECRIENFHLSRLKALKYMCLSHVDPHFPYLTSIHIEFCQNLISLFTGTLHLLPLLKELEIKFCSRLQSVFSKETKEAARGERVLPALENLCLLQLPRLSSICDGCLPSIRKLKVRGCWALRDLPIRTTAGDSIVPVAEMVEVDGEVQWWNNVDEKHGFHKEQVNFNGALNNLLTLAPQRRV